MMNCFYLRFSVTTQSCVNKTFVSFHLLVLKSKSVNKTEENGFQLLPLSHFSLDGIRMHESKALGRRCVSGRMGYLLGGNEQTYRTFRAELH